MRCFRAWVVAAFFSLCLFACTSTSSKQVVESKCTPGEQKDCTCTDGRKGAQACNDEGTGYEACVCGGAGSGGSGSGGGGSGGASGDGGSSTDGSASGGSAGASSGGSGGTGGSSVGSLGARCTSATDCSGSLQCVRDLAEFFIAGSIPSGLCTKPCTQDGDCGANGRCLAYSAGAGHCVETCTFGPGSLTTFDPNKCHGRPELGCSPIDGSGACIPVCNNDGDCDPAEVCNPKNGLCTSSPAQGAVLGSSCDVANPAVGCRGVCLELLDPAGQPVGMCTSSCTAGHPAECGWAGSGTKRDGVCAFFSSAVSQANGPGFGDAGFCAQLCNCTTECRQASLRCYQSGTADFPQKYGKLGFCGRQDPNSIEIPVCN